MNKNIFKILYLEGTFVRTFVQYVTVRVLRIFVRVTKGRLLQKIEHQPPFHDVMTMIILYDHSITQAV